MLKFFCAFWGVLFVQLSGGVSCSWSSEDEVVSSSEISEQVMEEQRWYNRFQQGYLMFDGWQEIEKTVLTVTPVEEREARQARLNELGKKIGKEWSRDNEVRRIDTAMIKNWGKILKNAVESEPEKIKEVLAQISSEVDSLLR